MATPRIVVVGSANVDLTTFTDVFPRSGETIFARAFDLGFGGKGANQAVAARLCGAEVAMVARVGDDLFGPATRANFQALGIDTTHVHLTPGVSSGVAPIFVDSAGQNRILVVKGANDGLTPADVDRASDLLSRADFVVLQLEIPVETVFHTIRLARKLGVRAILNPAPAQPLDLRQAADAEYIIPNETEAEALTGVAITSPDNAYPCARRLLDWGLRRAIITLGAQGAFCAGPEVDEYHVPAFPVEPVDTSGAGDAFTGSLAVFLASGFAERDAVRRANLYAALSTLSAGTQKSFVSRERFEREWAIRWSGL
jgi:ribokinase